MGFRPSLDDAASRRQTLFGLTTWVRHRAAGPALDGLPPITQMPRQVGPRATLETYTIIRFPYIDPETGDLRPVPFGYGFFQLDGSDTLFQHYFPIDDESKVSTT